MKKRRLIVWILGLVFLGGCAGRNPDRALPRAYLTPSGTRLAATPGSPQTPKGWHQVVPFDGIKPIYDPQFLPADEAKMKDNELVMGVAWGDQAKAYPVTVLRVREMVNDEMAGEPYLVSW